MLPKESPHAALPHFARSEKQIEAVKIGWSWPPFFSSFCWVLIKKLWWRAAGVLSVGFVANFLVNMGELMTEDGNEHGSLVEDLGWLLLLGVLLYTGGKGNDWVANRLERRGYKPTSIVSAPNAEGTVETFDENYVYDKGSDTWLNIDMLIVRQKREQV